MQEKVIYKTTARFPYYIFIALAVIAVIAMFVTAGAYDGNPGKAFVYFEYGYFWFLIGAAVFILLAILTSFETELIITNFRVSVSSKIRKKDLPANKITAVSRGAFGCISASTSGGHIILHFVSDRNGAYDALIYILINNQYLISHTGPEETYDTEEKEEIKQAENIVEYTQKKPASDNRFEFVENKTGYTVSKFNGEQLAEAIIPAAFDNRPVTSIGEKAFSQCVNLTTVSIPESVNEICSSAFANCNDLTNIKLPDSLTLIGNSAFSKCAGLTEIKIPAGVKEISNYAFSDCAGLTDVTIQDGITELGISAFQKCVNLTNIKLPASLQTINFSAFYKCTGIKKVFFSGSEKQWSEINIGQFNDNLLDAEIVYNYTGE